MCTIMDYNSLNLRELTVVDLCDDATLRKVFLWGENKELHLRSIRTMPSARWSAMLDLAEHTGDKALEAAVERQFAEDIAAFFNE